MPSKRDVIYTNSNIKNANGFCMVCFFYMTIVNSREDILKHENPEYIKSRPKWELGQGRIPDLSDYRKLSVDNMEEAMTLAKIGQIIGQQFIPTIQNKPFRTYFTQALILGASLITRSMAEKYGLDFEKYRSVLLVCPSRYGKQIGHSVKIMTTKGWKKHGELQIGDYVFHPSGKPIKVVGKKEWIPDHYLVHFQNGQSIECHANHEWRVYNKRKSNGRGNPQGGYEILETHEMVDKVLYKGGKGYRSRYLIDPASPCQFDKKEQPLDPYFFGCWLGDGTSKKPILTLSPEKAEHILPNIPFSVTSSYKLEGCSSYEFRHQNILTHLYSLEVFGDKHIPDCYKYGSPEQQKALLAGIIDTDGYVDRNGRVIISCANEKLAKDLLELLTLMGECPYETVVPATISSSGVVGKHDIHQIGYQPAYDLPTKFKYLTRLTPHRRIGITKIEKPKHSEPGNCIQVDSPDGLYLVGEKLIPTHNSFINGASILIHAGANGEEVQIGAATMPKAEIIQAKAVEMLPWTCEKLQEGLIVDGQEEDRFKKIKRLSTKVSKDNLRWTNGGSIGMFSTNETKKNADVSAAGAIGIGGDFAVFDEVQLMTPVGFRTASRFMVENPNTKRFCVGNPMINGHFKELYDNPNTFVVHINEVTCIIEERMTRRGIELTEMPTYSPEYRAFVCVDEETECLTPSGWKSIKNINKGDTIAQVGEGETIEFVPVKHTTKMTSPTILKTSFAHDEWMFTPDHRQYVYNTSRRTGKTKKKVYKVKDLPKGSHIRILSGGQNMKNDSLSPLDQLAIACQADGSIDSVYSGKTKTKPLGMSKWRVEVRKARKAERLESILKLRHIQYKKTIQKDGDTRFTFNLPNNITKNFSDYFSWDMGAKKGSDFLAEILEWDGCKCNNTYSTIVKDNADFVQAVAAQCGIRSSMSVATMWNGNTIYKVKLYDSNIRTTQHMSKEEIKWGKPVYCVTVPSGEWLARRHGHIINTGNCTEFPDERSGTRFFTTLPEVWDPAKLPQPVRKFYFLGIDSAYKGGDSLMMSLVSFNEGGGKKWFALERQEDLKKRFGGNWDANTTLDISLDILKTWEKYNVAAGCIDIGFGIHIYEKLRELDPQLPLEPINYSSKPTEWRMEQDYNAKYALNKRAELHLDLRDLASNDLIYICPDSYDEVRREMGEVAQAPAKQKIQIEPKKDIKARLGRSPDAMDSLCLGVHAAVLSGVLNGTNELQSDDIMEIIS